MKTADNNLKKSHILLSGLIVALMYMGFAIVSNIAPAGNNTFLMYDMKRQYVDFFAYYRTVLSGENNIFYSFSTALGSGTLGFFIYYLTSPFILLLSVFPQELLPVGITVIIGLKLIIAAMIMDAFLQYFINFKNSKSILSSDSISILLGAVSWAFSGFLIAHSMNTMWIDVIILLPLLIWFEDNIILKKKTVAYMICLFFMLLLNYYITYQILLFLVFWSLLRIWLLNPEKKITAIVNVISSTAAAGMMGGIFLMPTALELANSPKDITQLGLMLGGKNLSPFEVLSKLSSFAYDEFEPIFGIPQIFCGVLLIYLNILFFANPKVEKKEKVVMLSLYVMLMVSFCLDIVNLVWHAGMEPSGHPYRQAFLFIFLMVIGATKSLFLFKFNRVRAVFSSTLIFLCFHILILIGGYNHIFPITRWVNISLGAIYILLMIIYILKRNIVNHYVERTILSFIVFLQICDLTANACYIYRIQSIQCEKAYVFEKTINDISEAVDYISKIDNSFYRIENQTPREQNDSMQFGYNGITHYSSAGMTYVRYFLKELGYNDDTLYADYGKDNTETADSILGIKYLLNDKTANIHKDYIQIYNKGEYAYQNPYAMSVAIMTNKFDLSKIGSDADELSSDNWDEYIPVKNPFSLQEDIYSRLLGHEVKLFNVINRAGIISQDVNGYLIMNCKIVPEISGEIYLYLDGIEKNVQDLSIFINDEFVAPYGNSSCTKVLNLGYYEKGDVLQVRINGNSETADFGKESFVTEDTQALKSAYSELIDRQLEIKKISSSHLQIETKTGDGIFLTIPCEKGWNIKVDGKKVVPTAVYGALTYIPIDESGVEEHIVDMTFIPEGLYIGMLISCLGLLLAIIIVVRNLDNRASI